MHKIIFIAAAIIAANANTVQNYGEPGFLAGGFPANRFQDPRLADPRLADPRLADSRLADPRFTGPAGYLPQRYPDQRLADPRLPFQRLPLDPRFPSNQALPLDPRFPANQRLPLNSRFPLNQRLPLDPRFPNNQRFPGFQGQRFPGAPGYSNEFDATILRKESINDENGNFRYGFETSNQIQADAEGFIKNPGAYPDEQIQAIQGSYSHYTPEGAFVSVTYTADENGYRPVTTITRPGEPGYGITPTGVAGAGPANLFQGVNPVAPVLK